MISKMILSAKGLAANVARVRPLVRVRSFVNEQIVALGELSVAKFADELLLRSLAGNPPLHEGRRWRYREPLRTSLLYLDSWRMLSDRATGGAAAPSGQKSGTTYPVIEERTWISQWRWHGLMVAEVLREVWHRPLCPPLRGHVVHRERR